MFLSVITKVKGCSGKVFKVSNSKRAGSASELLLSDSTVIRVEKVVSKSEAYKVNEFPLTSNNKLSNIGSVLVLFITPPII